jgi:tetratricopeptide (TPR) repeat protein
MGNRQRACFLWWGLLALSLSFTPVAAQKLGTATLPDISPECLASVDEEVVAPRYFQLVTYYRMPAFFSARDELRYTSPEYIVKSVDALLDLRKRADKDSRIQMPEDRCLRAAAMMHTDVVLVNEEAEPRAAAEFHLDVAERLIELIADEEIRERFRRHWLLILGYFYQMQIPERGGPGPFTSAKEFFDEAVKRFPDDAEVTFAAGTLYEWSGSQPGGEVGHLKKASQLYEQALAVESGAVGALTRYGRVLEKLGRYDEAKLKLSKVVGLDADDFCTYTANLVLGNIAERHKDYPEAIEHYENALLLFPQWQVGYVALGHALHVSGRRQESAEVVEAGILLRPRFAEDYDGWGVYDHGMTGRFEPLWQQMREEAIS